MISIIIPNYNTEKYLERCVNSVLSQTYTELEIIIVDDGSTDASARMCDVFAERDKRIKVIHKENGGLSSARNAGLDIATGQFITFLDSDDYLAQNYIEHSLLLCEKNNADISIMKMCYIEENTNDEVKDTSTENIVIMSAKDAIEQSLYQVLYSCCAPGKLYKKDVLDAIYFPLNKLSEDLAVCHEILGNCSRVVYSNNIGYYYRQHSASIMHTFDPKRLDALEWTEKIEKYCSCYYPEIINAAKSRTFNVAVHLLLDLPDFGTIRNENYNRIWDEVKKTRVVVLKNKKTRIREKAAAILSFGGERVLKSVWRSKIAVKQKEN